MKITHADLGIFDATSKNREDMSSLTVSGQIVMLQ